MSFSHRAELRDAGGDRSRRQKILQPSAAAVHTSVLKAYLTSSGAEAALDDAGNFKVGNSRKPSYLNNNVAPFHNFKVDIHEIIL